MQTLKKSHKSIRNGNIKEINLMESLKYTFNLITIVRTIVL